ncbi:response regulator [Shewanella sp. PP-Sp27a-2]
MNILHLEDDLPWFERVIKPALDKINHIVVFHATNKAEALKIIEDQDIDLAMLDLSVPNNDPDGIPDLKHGLSTAWYIRTKYPGMPILILTGQSTEEAAEKFEEENTFTIFWDGIEKPLVKLRKKRQLPDVINYLERISASLSVLDNIELDYDRRKLILQKLDKRVIQLFCKKNEAVAAKITPLSEGLSSAQVLYVQLINHLGQTYSYTLAKIDQHDKVFLEKSNYQNYVTKLPVGCFPSYLDEYYAGCNDRKGFSFNLLYTLTMTILMLT